MGKHCEHEDGPATGLLEVRAWSGEKKDKEVACDLKGGADIRHFVRIRNWNTHLVDIELLESKITTRPDPLAEFQHPSASVTPVRWWKIFQVPGKKRGSWWKGESDEPGEREFHYVRLSSTDQGGGSEDIFTRAHVKYDDQTSDMIDVTIRVDT